MKRISFKIIVIDDRDPEKDSEHLQLSNFSLLEDRITHNLEIYQVIFLAGKNGVKYQYIKS